jgi:hypothetical protein
MEENLPIFPKNLVFILLGILVFSLLIGFLSNFLGKRYEAKIGQLQKIIDQKRVYFEEFSAQEAATFYKHFFKIKETISNHITPTKTLNSFKSVLPYFVRIESLNIDFKTGKIDFTGTVPNLTNLAELIVSLKKEPIFTKVEFGGYTYSTPVKFSISVTIKPEYLKISQ